ncbi:MAG TPA: DNA polymerase III subunit gamma/tau [Candidatus Dormibacteraeota bacterium]|nr:DNA polymerase III subunit gamma/tau [Candidatus Dormibacteraeota bacterium]
MSEALYRKYRSKKFSDVIGQDHITQTLERSIKHGKISHAYLFSGPRGVGKTSVARILAHSINNFEYLDDDTSYLDIIELDAASNRKIEDMKQLIDRVWLAPSDGKYKVFIIDEVHMLTRDAFNALLKTLEEPPEYVVFILATTEAHKVPETVLSRTQQFTFRPITHKKIIDHLAMIANNEKIKIDPDAIEFIADYGEGSFRDSISLLDQASNIKNKITLSDLEFIIGSAPREIVNQIIEARDANSILKMHEVFSVINSNGYSVDSIVSQLIKILKSKLTDKNTVIENSAIIKTINELLNISRSNDQLTSLEIALYGSIINNENYDKPPKKLAELAAIDTNATKRSEIKKSKKITPPESTKSHPVDENIKFSEVWDKTLEDLRIKHSTLYSIIKLSKMNAEDEKIILSTRFPFHQKSLSENKNKDILNATLNKFSGKNYKIEVILNKDMSADIKNEIKDTVVDLDITSISNIFGGAEMVE